MEVLNFANSSGLWNEELTSEVLAPQIFPNVNKLILTRAGYENGYDVDDEVWSQIEDWPISYLDLSFVRANVLNLTSFFRRCKHLRTIKMKGIYVATLTY